MICDQGYEHPDMVEAPAETETEAVTDAAVRIAEIESETAITLARIGAKTETTISEDDRDARIAELEGQLAGMAATLAALQPPEPEPVPVVVAEPEPEPVMTEPVAEAPPIVEETPKKPKSRNVWWG